MDIFLRALCIYVFLLVILRISGKRTLSETTAFDFVLLLIIAETTQQALLGQDYSITNALLLIATLVGFDILLSIVKQRWKTVEEILDGVPLVIVEKGRPLMERMNKARVDVDDVLSAAREKQGLKRMEQIEYAVLERNGTISILPKEQP
ncbi:MAG TPA: YetF domain-containing protein [Gammaproteobacteria bacterium]|nr:YetF domain-containing protein [Gammaproteobacteria bacterium]